MAEISIVRGTDASLNLTFTDKDGLPINLTGSTVFFTMKKKDKLNIEDPTDVNAIIKTEQTTHIDPVAGETTINLTNIETRVDAGKYVADFQIIDSVGLIANTITQDMEIKSETTQRTS